MVRMLLTQALLRLPGDNFAQGLTQSGEGAPDPALALAQHQRYRQALEAAGLALTVLPADPRHPDGCFVEDTALLTERGAILTRPGAPSRRGEVDAIEAELRGAFPELVHIEAPGTLDAGDVCEADGHFLIGLSARTNEAGASQLAGFLGDLGYRADVLDIRGNRSLLHLKTGIAYLGEGRLLATADFPRHPALAAYEIVKVPAVESYAANALRMNGQVLVAAGYPATRAAIESLGFETVALEMSEFRKLDGGLSCLSLRW
jgi:dimethylargininase